MGKPSISPVQGSCLPRIRFCCRAGGSEVSISWPAQLNNKCALKLVARGRIVRFEDGRAAMEIQQYEFRTHSTGGGRQAWGPGW